MGLSLDRGEVSRALVWCFCAHVMIASRLGTVALVPNSDQEAQYILLPRRGIGTADSTSHEVLNHLALDAPRAQVREIIAMPVVDVVDEVSAEGPKLVSLGTDAHSALRALDPGIRIVPVVYYYPAVAPRPTLAATVQNVGVSIPTVLRILSASTGAPVAGAAVIAFTDYENRVGAQAVSDAEGAASLAIGPERKTIERLAVYPPPGWWSVFRSDVDVTADKTVELREIPPGHVDCVRHHYGSDPGEAAGAGVRVGVVDTGVDLEHPQLRVDGGFNAVQGEDPSAFGHNGNPHGTHVAGTIAARPGGTTPIGVAPGVTLESYRVFGEGKPSASNFAIVKAVHRAVERQCDILNMSLGGGPADEALHEAITTARESGMAVFVASGNDGRQPVAFPAADTMAVAVSACGRVGTFPDDAAETLDVTDPFGTDRSDFIARFSNIGPEIDVTGPGVGVVSTVPGGIAAMSGTSMACPAVAGIAARLLSARPDLLAMPRDASRSDAIIREVLGAARAMGFGAEFEGQGLPL